MKWTKSVPKKDGTYFTFVEESDAMGVLLMIKGKWYAKIAQGVIPVPSVEGIDWFCKITRPKHENSKVRQS